MAYTSTGAAGLQISARTSSGGRFPRVASTSPFFRGKRTIMIAIAGVAGVGLLWIATKKRR